MNIPMKTAGALLASVLLFSSTSLHAWQSDNGGGTYTSPPLYADYPDPDIIRVGDDFYMVSSTFVNSPGRAFFIPRIS